jgi:hypothetical protein
VLDFAEFLKQKCAVKRPRRNLEGLWADLKVDITESNIEQARLEMWGQVSERGYRMNGMMLDTHAAVWFPLESQGLSPAALARIENAIR